MNSDGQFEIDWTKKLPIAVQEKIAEGMAQADENADAKWKHWFDAAVMAAARKKPEITSDDVLAEIESLPEPPGTHNLSAIGPAMRRAAGMGILRNTGRVERSKVERKNGNLHAIWESKVYGSDPDKLYARAATA